MKTRTENINSSEINWDTVDDVKIIKSLAEDILKLEFIAAEIKKCLASKNNIHKKILLKDLENVSAMLGLVYYKLTLLENFKSPKIMLAPE